MIINDYYDHLPITSYAKLPDGNLFFLITQQHIQPFISFSKNRMTCRGCMAAVADMVGMLRRSISVHDG
jgi:hypothetical protein